MIVLHLTPFFDQIRTTELFTFLRCRLRSVSYLFKWYSYRIKPSTFVLLLCILQGLHPSGFSLCITRIKNLFFWKEIDKTFCCFRYSVICNLPLITSLLLLISCFYVKLVKLKSDFIYRMLARGCYFYQLPFLIRSNLYTNV